MSAQDPIGLMVQAAVEAAIFRHIERRNERDAEDHLAARATEREYE